MESETLGEEIRLHAKGENNRSENKKDLVVYPWEFKTRLQTFNTRPETFLCLP